MKFINSDNLNDALSAFRTKCNAAYAPKSHTHTSINYQDTRAVNTTPAQVPLGLSVHLKSNNTDGLSDGGSYHPSLMIKPWNDKSGWPVGQIATTQNNNLYFRVSKSSDDTTWNAWQKVSKDGHTHNYAGSSSAGGAATSANKVNTNLAIKLNGGSTEGTNLFTFNGSAAKTVNITPSAIGAAASSHGTHVSLASAAPKANGTAAVGTSSKQAREDHVHPLQTTMNGLTFWTGTQEQYDAIATKSATTIYMITE
jgi:hypothetical protein